MKTKIILTALLCALNINAASAAIKGNVGASYATDYYFRGAELGADSIQANIGVNTTVQKIEVFLDLLTNQTTGTSTADTNVAVLAAGTTFSDGLLSLYGGLINIDVDGSESTLDGFVSLKLNTVLTPSVTVFRNTDDDLYTVEGSISHQINTDLCDLTVSLDAGTTNVTRSTNRSYVGAGFKISKDFDNLTPYASVSLIDADDISRDTITQAGLTFKF